MQGVGFRALDAEMRVQGEKLTHLNALKVDAFVPQKPKNDAFVPRKRDINTRSPQMMRPNLISQKVFIKSFCRSRFPHKSVNLSFIITDTKLTDLCGNRLFQNDFVNTSCETKSCEVETGGLF